MAEPLSDSTLKALRQVIAALSETESILGKNIPVRLVESFVAVGSNPGITRAELAQLLQISPNTAFQDLRTLSFEKRNGDIGLGLIEGRWDVFDMRQRRYNLTPRGELALARLDAAWDAEAS